MREFIKLALIISSLTLSSTYLQAESLKDIYLLAIDNDPQYRAAQATLAAGLERKIQGRSQILPSLNARLSYDQSERENRGFDSSTGSFAAAAEESTTWTKNGTLVFSQPLFDMSKWYRYKAAKTASKRSEITFAGQQQALILRSAEAYFDILQAVDTLSTRQAEEKAFSHQLEQIKQKFDVGLTAITEVHEAQAVYDNAIANRLTAEGNLNISFEALEVLTGRSFDELSPLKTDFPTRGPTPNNRNEWEQMALEKNIDLLVAKFTETESQYNYQSSKSGHYPTLNANARYSDNEQGGFNENNPRINPDRLTETFSVGVELDIPIFNGLDTSSKRRQAKHELHESEERRKKARRDAIQNTRTKFMNLTTFVATIKARKQAIVSNTSALEATQAGYEVGTRDLVDVLNAQRNLFRAKNDYSDTLYSYIMTSLELKEAAGILNPDDIDKLDSWLDKSRTVKNLP